MPNRIRVTDSSALIQQAWDWCWEENIRQRAANYYGVGPYLTATEIHSRVRAHAVELLKGLPYGSTGADGGQYENLRCSITLHDCRAWLLSQARSGRLSIYTAGRGHCSGARFRPKGEELTEAEQDTLAKKARGPIVHVKGEDGRPACSPPAKPRSIWSRSRRKFPAFVSTYHPVVTCKRCAKLYSHGQVSSKPLTQEQPS